MRFSINDYSISSDGKGWGPGWPTDRSEDMAGVTADRSGAKVNVHKRIARLVDSLLDETERRGYDLIPAQTGGFCSRPIADTDPPAASNHSWGLAVDLNWEINEKSDDGQVHGDLPEWLPPLWGRYGFAWGGHYVGSFKDPMHLEFMGGPDDADDMTRSFDQDRAAALGAARMGVELQILRADNHGPLVLVVGGRRTTIDNTQRLALTNQGVPEVNLTADPQLYDTLVGKLDP